MALVVLLPVYRPLELSDLLMIPVVILGFFALGSFFRGLDLLWDGFVFLVRKVYVFLKRKFH